MKVLAVAGFALAGLASIDAFAPTSSFAPSRVASAPKNIGRSRAMTAPKMVLNEALEAGSTLLAAVPNVPFVDEITGEPQGFTAPLTHFGSVISLWVLFALPVWSAAYKQAGGDTPDWAGVSQVREDAPGVGRQAKYIPDYDGPSFREGLEYVLSFAWKPPILIAWKPRADLDRNAMDPARDTVVSSLYKGFGGALDKTAIYDEEDQLLILSEMEVFPETELGKRREKQAAAAGLFTGNPSFGKSLIEYSEETKKGRKEIGTVSISAAELAALRADAAKVGGASTPVKAAPARQASIAPPARQASISPPARQGSMGGFQMPSFSIGSLGGGGQPAAPKPAPTKAAGPTAAEKAAAAAAAAAAAKQAAAAAAAKAAAAKKGAAPPQVGLGTMPVPKAGNIPFFGKTQKVAPPASAPPAAEKKDGGFQLPKFPFGK